MASTNAERKKTPEVPETWEQRLRHYLPFVAVPFLVVVLGLVVICLASILLTGSRLGYLPGTIGAAWLASHGAPVRFDGVTIAVLPIVPVVAVAALLASRIRAATAKRVSVADLLALLVLTAAVSLTLSAVALFMVGDASTVYPIEVPPPALALIFPLLTNLLGFAAGISPTLWRALARRYGVPEVVADSAFTAIRALGLLLAAGLVVYLGLLAAGYPRIRELIDAFPVLSSGGGVILTLLSVAYLPNAAVETLGVLLGGSFRIADGAASLFAVDTVALPPLPLFAAIPGAVAPWAPVLALVPAAVVIFSLRRTPTLLHAAATSTAMGVLALVAALYAGGTAGAYGYLGVNPLVIGGLTVAWAFVVSGIAVLVVKLIHRD
ncbi:DUF6350 family protein [Corynebacterium sp.]|uniref:cell division protein PerM n=1 Tax=Corynebacterium sp. TaxID=1720 RepID=UPI002A912662|nr:DUF6350 family protein [Corynebacterium sp.]MDY5784486.1 DUF6350 family protein [Corynebacterium sp.]